MTSSTSSSPINSITGHTFEFAEPARNALLNQVKSQQGRLNTADINALCTEHSLTQAQLLRACLPIASLFAVAPISQFLVGAIVVGLDAQQQPSFYFGANVEFAHQPLSLVVHAEQSAINNAWLNGAKSIVKIAISDAPCGYCRQFMNELADAETFDILLPTQKFKLTELLPAAFGPKDLGNQYSLFNPAPQSAHVDANSEVCPVLIEQAKQAYVPYTQNFSAVKITTFNHGNFYGRYAENAAYSPSLAPLQSAISQLYLAGLSLDNNTVEKVELLQSEGAENQLQVSEAVLASYDNLPALQSYSLSFTQ